MSSIATFPTLLLLHLGTVVFKVKKERELKELEIVKIEMGVSNF
jgi:hypothetical protein